jgi:hypothetical protein
MWCAGCRVPGFGRHLLEFGTCLLGDRPLHLLWPIFRVHRFHRPTCHLRHEDKTSVIALDLDLEQVLYSIVTTQSTQITFPPDPAHILPKPSLPHGNWSTPVCIRAPALLCNHFLWLCCPALSALC